jgi:hypothetical protein
MLRILRSLSSVSAFVFILLLFSVMTSSLVFAGPMAVILPPNYTLQQQIQANDGDAFDSFGNYFVKDGNTLLIAASHGAYVFVNNGSGWTQQAKFTAPTGPYTRFLGNGIALSGDTAVVNVVPNYDFGLKGQILIFTRSGTTWTLQAALTPSDGVPQQDFGVPFFVDANTLLVGAPSGDASYLGSVYIFTRSGTTWSEVGKFSASDGQLVDTFGSSFAMDGNTVMIGAHYSPQPTYGTGAVYVYNRSGTTFTQQAKLTLSNPVGFPNFGSSIDLQGNTALIGAPQDNGLRGSVYVFVNNGSGWSQQAKLVPSDIINPSGSVYFGTKVSLDGDTAAIGAPFNPDEARHRGAVYFFSRSTGQWMERSKLTPNDNLSNHTFGSDVLLEGELLFVGSPVYFDARPGSVYVYSGNSDPSSVELLVNGGFETDSDQNKIPDGWSRKNTTKDERRCNQPNEAPVAYSGNCAYFMKGGSPTGGKLVQNVNLQQFNLKAGDHIRLTGFYNKQSTGPLFVYLFVNYANFPDEQRRIVLRKTTNGYQPINPSSFTLKATPLRVRVELVNQTTSDKTWIDGMSLILSSPNQSLTLPLPMDEQTESLIPLP